MGGARRDPALRCAHGNRGIGDGRAGAPLHAEGMLGGARAILALHFPLAAITRDPPEGAVRPHGITSRHLALENLTEAFELTPDVLHGRFVRHAPVLAAEAARAALDDAGVGFGQIEALLLSTCTGYLCPGLSSYVIERLGLPSNILALDLVGQGCGAALPNLRTAEALLASGRCRRVLAICVEVCSAAFYLDEDPGVLISACLFGDGAGAMVLANEANGKRRIEWKAGSSSHDPSLRDRLRFESKGGMLRNVLSAEVPRLAAEQNERVLRQTLTPPACPRRTFPDGFSTRADAMCSWPLANGWDWPSRTCVGAQACWRSMGTSAAPRFSLSCKRPWRTARRRVTGGWLRSAPASAATARCGRLSREAVRSMKRVVEPELLDQLPPEDPGAMGSRRDLQRLNAWMANPAHRGARTQASFQPRAHSTPD